MKKILFSLLFVSSLAFSQEKDTLNLLPSIDMLVYQDSDIDIDVSFLKDISKIKSFTSLEFYNSNSGMNDVYFMYPNKEFKITSYQNSENLFRVNKIDSTNPYGASSFSEALVIGGLGKFLKFKIN